MQLHSLGMYQLISMPNFPPVREDVIGYRHYEVFPAKIYYWKSIQRTAGTPQNCQLSGICTLRSPLTWQCYLT